MSKYYVYELWNTIKNLPFYVGFGKRSTRPKDHIVESLIPGSEHKKGSNPHKIHTIRQIHAAGLSVGIKIVHMTEDKNSAIDEEIRLIKHYGRSDINTGILTNMTDGGEGAGSRVYSEKERQKRRDNRVGKSFDELFGAERSAIARKKISDKRRGIRTGRPSWNTGKTKDTDESVLKISKSRKGIKPINKGKRMKDLIPDYQNHFLGKTHSLESRLKISCANKGRCAGKNNPMFGKSAVKGRKWYHNGVTQFYLFENDSTIIDQNLQPGRIKKND